MFRTSSSLVTAVALFSSFVAPPQVAALAAGCRYQASQRVFLASYSSDPNVFVWDNRDRLIAYAASGGYDAIDNVLRHSVLVKPGTRAIVAVCRAATVRRRYVADPSDAIGIKITSGPDRNRWGWVSSDDVHPLEAGLSSRNKARIRTGGGGLRRL